MALSATEHARRRGVVFAALQYLAKNWVDRDEHLDQGATRVEGTIEAKVGKGKVTIPFAGSLNVAGEQPSASSSAPSTEAVLCEVFSRLRVPTHERDAILEKIAKGVESTGQLSCAEVLAGQVRPYLKRMRVSKQITKRGAVTFAMDAS